MPCYLLHTLEQPDTEPYSDPAVRDVVGRLPQFYCTYCDPIRRLKPSSAYKCLQRAEPCWRPTDQICTPD